MSFPNSDLASVRARASLAVLGPALLACALLLVPALRGLADPLTLLLFAGLAAAGLWVTLARAPVLLFWLVPLSMAFFVDSWIEVFDVLILGLSAAALFAGRGAGRLRALRLEALEWRFLLFLASLGLSFFAPLDFRKFAYASKLYVMGFIAFELARHAARRYGRATLAWGPAVFSFLTCVTLFERAARIGGPAFQSGELRGYISNIRWGTSNYVAAVLVLCLPLLLYLYRDAALDWRVRLLVLGGMFANVATVLVTGSRGGLLLSAGYLVAAGLRLRRQALAMLLVVAFAIGIVALTPLGQVIAGRFTSTRGVDSAVIRTMIWGLALARGLNHLPFGIGAGQGALQPDRLAGADPHDFYLTLFSEGGPLALALWLWLAWTLWRKAGRMAAVAETHAAGEALRGTLAVASCNALFEPTFPGYLYMTLFWWVAGLLEAAEPPGPRPPGG